MAEPRLAPTIRGGNAIVTQKGQLLASLFGRRVQELATRGGRSPA